MYKLFQINVCCNVLSTGTIAENIGNMVMAYGWESYIAYGRQYKPSNSHIIKIGSKLGIYEHYIEKKIFDNDGLASRYATKVLIRKIKKINPDIIHLHNIHGHYLNYRLLFEFLNNVSIPVVWTLHDCWAFTGRCGHFNYVGCEQWKSLCRDCPKQRVSTLLHRTKEHYLKKQRLFTSKKNIVFVAVSSWLYSMTKLSFLKDKDIRVVYNGVSLDLFNSIRKIDIYSKYNIPKKYILLGVASAWSNQKGLHDYYRLAEVLSSDFQIVLVGLNDKQISNLPVGIKGIKRTTNFKELIELYAMSNIVLNLSYQESFGMTTIEGMACGVPSIVYNTTASPELVSQDTGIVVEAGNISQLVNAIYTIKNKGNAIYVEPCKKRVETYFNKDKNYLQYLHIYEELLTINKM